MTIYKKVDWPQVQHIYPTRHCMVLLLEYLSLIPLEHVHSISNANFFYIRLRYVYRMIRIFFLVRRKSKIYADGADIKAFLKFVVTFSIISVTAACIVIPIIYTIERVEYFNVTDFYMLYYTTTSRLTSKGFGESDYGHMSPVYEYVLLCALNIIAFVLTSAYTGQIACLSMPQIKYHFLFAHNFMLTTKYMKEFKKQNLLQWKNYHNSFRHTVLNFFREKWQHTQINQWKTIPSGRIPDVLIRDILLDITWDAFKHSHLFRHESAFFLRYLSVKMKLECFLPGELVIRRDKSKAMMIYIVSGILQVISEENNETPMVSLSGGSCIGESTLVVGYTAKYTIVCKTYCEVILLKRKDFITIFKDHPKTYRRLIKHIHGRYKLAMQYWKVKNHKHSRLCNVYTAGALSLNYIRYATNKFLNNKCDLSKTRSHYGLQLGIQQHIFCPFFLDLVIITEELELVSDSVFIKKKFPFIFQPSSIVLKWWDAFIDLISAVFILCYPVALYITKYTNGKQITTSSILFISVMWTFDVYIKMSTAVKTRDYFLTKVSNIIYYRLSTMDFITDLFCIIPLGLLLNIINSNITATMMLYLEMHKLLKVYRILRIFNRINRLNTNLMLTVMYIKVFIVIFVLMYYFTFFLYMLVCSDKCLTKYLNELMKFYNIQKTDRIKRFIHMMTLVSFFINNTTVYGFMELLEDHQCLVVIFMQLVFYYVYVYLSARAIAADTVNQQEKHEFKEFVSTMSVMMKNFNFDISVEKKVWKYLKDQYYTDMGMSFINPNRLAALMSSNVHLLYRYVMYGKFIRASKIFQGSEETLIMNLAKRVKIHIYYTGEIITYAGEICKEFHLLAYGYCHMYNRGKVKILKPTDTFSVVEMCLGIPIANTVVACTECKIISLTLEDYLDIMRKNRRFKEEIDSACASCEIKPELDEIEENLMERRAFQYDATSAPSFRYFRYTRKKSDNLQFLQGFGKYGEIFKYLLQRHTITPNGSFMFYYEGVRCLCAFGTNLLCTMINTTEMGFFYYILICFDITAWIDLYVMHHVCYFNNIGIEISHPMHTALHYWKHAFIIDLVGSLPLDYIFSFHKSTVVYLRLNRLLQLHRIVGFFSHINASNIFRTSTLDILKYLPLTILIMNYVAYLLLYTTCDVSVTHKAHDECACRALVWKRFKNTTFSQINAQGASLLMVTGALTMIAIAKLRMKHISEMVFLSILIIVGSVFSIWLTAKIVANNFYRNSDLTSYQQAMRDLINFYNYRKIDKNIKKEIIEHYEHMWQKKKGKDIHKMLDRFNTSFKEDLLYGIFGRYLLASTIFPNADRTFYKNLLLEMDYKVYLKRAVIYKVNDIHGKIFFLLCGEVDVLGPDYNKLTKLTSGSLFGSLDNCLYTRQTLMMVARSNVEILEISSVRFHYILSKYQLLEKHFRRMTAVSVDYIETSLKIRKARKARSTYTRKTTMYSVYTKLSPLYKENFFMKAWAMFLLVVVDFFGFHLELYQKVTWDTRMPTLVCLYLFDVLYIIKIYLTFHTCYNNEYGITIRDRKDIALRYVNNKLRFYIDIISTTPLELMSIFFTSKDSRELTFSMLRLNRTLRISFVCISLKNTGEKLDINVILMRIVLIFTWLTIYIHICTVIFYHTRALLRVYRPEYHDSLALYVTSLYIVAYTSIGSAANTFNVTYNFWIVLYTVLITAIGRFIVTLFIAETCVTIESINKNKNLYKQFCVNLMKFSRSREVSLPIIKETSKYLQMLWVHHRGIHVPELLKEAPQYLKEATMNAMFGYHLRQHPVLKKCHIDLIRQMAAEIELLVFFPDNHIAYQGDIDRCIYFIHEGVVEALSKDSLEMEVVEKTLVTGDYFGLIQGLHPRMGHKYTYKARKHTIINVLRRDKWFHMLVFFPASKVILDECLEAASQGIEFD
ncbi:hypothetical protein Trydic_g23779 [Trypoxylus dichotomus]